MEEGLARDVISILDSSKNELIRGEVELVLSTSGYTRRGLGAAVVQCLQGSSRKRSRKGRLIAQASSSDHCVLHVPRSIVHRVFAELDDAQHNGKCSSPNA
jgi:hypothetical protein